MNDYSIDIEGNRNVGARIFFLIKFARQKTNS